MRISDWSSDVCSSDLVTSDFWELEESHPVRVKDRTSNEQAITPLRTEISLWNIGDNPGAAAAFRSGGKGARSMSRNGLGACRVQKPADRKSDAEGKRVSVGVASGG